MFKGRLRNKGHKKRKLNKVVSLFVSFICAIGLYIVVKMETDAMINFRDSLQRIETLNNVDVLLDNYGDKLHIDGLPETVTVNIQGDDEVVKNLDFSDVYVTIQDMDKLVEGQQMVRLEAKQVPEGMQVQVIPSKSFIDVSKD